MGLFSRKPKNSGIVIQADPTTITGSTPEVKAAAQQTGSDPKSLLSDLVLEYIPEGVIIIDSNLNVRLTNPASEHLMGKRKDEIVGLRYDTSLKLFDKDGNPVTEANDPILYVAKSKQMGETSEYLVKTLGVEQTTPVSIIIMPTSGESPNYVITIRDITRQLKEESEKNDFISTASHEMRTPVASIEGYLGLALNPATATIDARAKAYLEKAHESSKHLGKLFQDLLDTTKMDEHKVKLNYVPCDMQEIVRSIADGQAPNIQAKGLQYQFGGRSGESSLQTNKKIGQLLYASVDVDSLREIVDNLIENAIKYTKEGFVNINVSGDMNNVIISVQDSGIGIAAEEHTHIFQKFYRVDNSDTREIGGTGLGLYLVKQRVEQMHGRIWVESALGKGSTFFVSFPRMDSETYKQARFVYENTKQQQEQNKLLEN